jgi:hypothetical protein
MRYCLLWTTQASVFFLHAADFGNEKVMIYWNMKRRKFIWKFCSHWTHAFVNRKLPNSIHKSIQLRAVEIVWEKLSSGVSTLLASCQLAEIAVEIVWEKWLQ